MKPPAHLSESARAAWVEIASGVAESAIDGIEGPALEAYACAVARQRDAQRRIDSEGMIVTDDKGRAGPHPAIAIESAASAQIRAWVARYRPHVRAR